MGYLLTKQLPLARPYLEESVSLDPNQVPSLLALGTLIADYPTDPSAPKSRDWVENLRKIR